MPEVIQGLLDNGVHVTRNVLNYSLRKYTKPAISSAEEARHPLFAININLDQESNISRLHAVVYMHSVYIYSK
jgi:hypothetical protein